MKREEVKQQIPGITDEQLNWLMGENGSDINREKGRLAEIIAERDDLKTRLDAANGRLEGYDPEWKSKAAQAQAEADKKIAEMQFQGLLNSAIATAKGRNGKAITALLDVDTLRGSKNQEADIQAALAELQKSSSYLFEADEVPPPYAGGTGTHGISDPQGGPASLAGALRERYKKG